MQFYFHANQINHFHNNGFTLRFALKQRHKGLGNGLCYFFFFFFFFFLSLAREKCVAASLWVVDDSVT